MNEKQDPAEISEDDAALLTLIRNLSAVIDRVQSITHDPTNPLADRLRDHLGADPKGLPVLSQELPPYQLVDVQVALDVWTGISNYPEMEVIRSLGSATVPPLERVAGRRRNVWSQYWNCRLRRSSRLA